MAQASFFYYNPESGSDSRQHDLFTPQPSAILKSSPMPTHESMQHLYMPAIARPVNAKPALLGHEGQVLSVETEFSGFDEHGYPRTPDLSSGGSAVSSPPHSNYLPTPTSSFFESLTGVKEGCEQDVKSEILAHFDFRTASPPLTPVFVNPPNVTANGASQASELLSTSSCPSLSPSPSPAPQQAVASQHADNFCDPRILLVNSNKATPLISELDIPTLPAFIPSNDDLLLGCGPSKDNSALEPLPPVVDSVPFYDCFGDLDSDTDFITDLSQDVGVYAGQKRQRVDSIPFSEELSEDEWSMSPPADATEHAPAAKKQKTDETDFASSLAADGGDAADGTVSVSGDAADDGQDDSMQAGDSGSPGGQHANRRGRKQSLTDDPSKTFVCTLCSRRFRRQEHLKRHYRSLHTQDKPFECTDCGKKFSRSDNLAQHARTHGNTTTIVGLTMPELDEKTAMMSAHLFETAAAVSSSSSSGGSSNGASDDEKAAAKKRKRDE